MVLSKKSVLSALKQIQITPSENSDHWNKHGIDLDLLTFLNERGYINSIVSKKR